MFPASGASCVLRAPALLDRIITGVCFLREVCNWPKVVAPTETKCVILDERALLLHELACTAAYVRQAVCANCWFSLVANRGLPQERDAVISFSAGERKPGPDPKIVVFLKTIEDQRD